MLSNDLTLVRGMLIHLQNNFKGFIKLSISCDDVKLDVR